MYRPRLEELRDLAQNGGSRPVKDSDLDVSRIGSRLQRPLWRLQKEMASDIASRGRDPDDVSHCQIMPADEAGWQ